MRHLRGIGLICALQIAVGTAAQGVFRLDTTFRTTLEARNIVDALVLPDGDVVVSGAMRYASDPFGQLRGGLRLNPDGSRELLNFPEVAFMGGMIVPWEDRVYVGSASTMRRFYPDDFTQDPTFQASDPLMFPFQSGQFHVYPDGSVVMTGVHDLVDAAHGFVGSYELVWLTATGRLDTTKIHRNTNGYLRTLKQTHDGRFMLFGSGTLYDGHPVPRVLRVLPDGAWDSTFVAPFVPFTGFCFGFLPLPDGRCYAAGQFFLPGSSDTLHLVRFMPDGSLDPTFNNAVDLKRSPSVSTAGALLGGITPWGSDRLLAYGSFDHVNGLPRKGIFMIDTLGNVLPEYFPGAGCGLYNYNGSNYDGISSAAPLGDTALYVWGAYHGYDDGLVNDPGQRLISRLRLVDIELEAPDARAVRAPALRLAPNPAGAWVVASWPQEQAATELVVRDASGRALLRQRVSGAEAVIETRALAPGSYVVELLAGQTALAREILMVQ